MDTKENAPQNENLKVEFEFLNEKFTINGHNDHIMSIINHYDRFYEVGMLEYIRQNIPDGGIYVDAGANIGNHTLFFSAFCADFVHAFEVAPHNFYYLKNNVMTNGFHEDVKLHMRPLSNQPDVNYRLTGVDPENMGMIRIERGGMMKSVTIDQHLQGQSDVRLIKVDCEGHDMNVLRGAIRTIERSQPHIFIEGDKKELYPLMKQLGYEHERTFNHTPTHHYKSKYSVS